MSLGVLLTHHLGRCSPNRHWPLFLKALVVHREGPCLRELLLTPRSGVVVMMVVGPLWALLCTGFLLASKSNLRRGGGGNGLTHLLLVLVEVDVGSSGSWYGLFVPIPCPVCVHVEGPRSISMLLPAPFVLPIPMGHDGWLLRSSSTTLFSVWDACICHGGRHGIGSIVGEWSWDGWVGGLCATPCLPLTSAKLRDP